MSPTELEIRCANKQDMKAVAQMIIVRNYYLLVYPAMLTSNYRNFARLVSFSFGVPIHEIRKKSIIGREHNQELAAYHKTTEFPKTTWRDLQRDGFESESPAFRCIVAERKKDNQLVIVGYAIYFPIYSSREGRSLMLEDLFVKADERHHGIGNLLFNTVVKEAYSMGCRRMDFHVAEWNRARSWYESKGAVNLTGREGRCCWRLSGDALRAAATTEC